MKLSVFSAMGIGVILAALLLIWEEVSVTTRGMASFASTFWFTALSLIAIMIYSVAVMKAPDNEA